MAVENNNEFISGSVCETGNDDELRGFRVGLTIVYSWMFVNRKISDFKRYKKGTTLLRKTCKSFIYKGFTGCALGQIVLPWHTKSTFIIVTICLEIP